MINVYHPTDPEIINPEDFNDEELNEDFRAIDKIRTSEEFDELLIIGDRNADFDRVNAYVNKVKKFDKERNLYYSWNKFNIDYTHIHTDDISTAKLDHILWTAGLDDHVAENLSRHSPIWIKLNVQDVKINREQVSTSKKVSWSKSTEMERLKYVEDLNQHLASLNIRFETLDCRDPKCSDEKHLDNLEIFTENLIQTINKSANDNLNTVGGKKKTTKKKVYPGWKEMVSCGRKLASQGLVKHSIS